MSALTVRDVPEDQIQTLKIRAAQAGKSLQAYFLDLVERETAKPTMAEMMERLNGETTADISTADILSAIDEGRAGRWSSSTATRSRRQSDGEDSPDPAGSGKRLRGSGSVASTVTVPLRDP